jgi:hypothetical protein
MSRILLVTIILIGRSGTEVVCCETARGLRKRGHEVTIYTQHDGPTADHLRVEGFQVTTDLSSVTVVPDIIQANQTFPLLEAIGHFPAAPAISICHDAFTWHNEPVDLPSIRRHVAVDFACRERIASRFPRLAEQVEILHNAVDLDAFQPRASLPERPKRALILLKSPRYLNAVREACAQRGLELSIIGPAAGNEVDDLPAFFRKHDLVFASARSALEALAFGCAVIVLDWRGFAGLVTSEVVASWRQDNFGSRVLSRPISTELIVDAIDRYDASDAQLVSGFICAHSSLEGYLDRLEAMHREVIAEGTAQPVDRAELIDRMGRSFRPFELAWHAQRDAELQNFVRSMEEQFQARASARETELRAEFQERLQTREAELHAMLDRRLQTREAELRAQFDKHASNLAAREAELETMVTELHRQLDIVKVDFAAFRAWASPLNLPRRVLYKILREIVRVLRACTPQKP